VKQVDIANELAVSESAVSKWLKGVNAPDADQLAHMVKRAARPGLGDYVLGAMPLDPADAERIRSDARRVLDALDAFERPPGKS
jgi:transcriptional regulator with XRE-family HTH domain